MANFIVRAGVDSYYVYGEETTFGTKATNVDKNFGLITSLTPNIRRNLVRVRGTTGELPDDNTTSSSIDSQSLLRGNFEGDLSVEFQPSNFRFMKYVLGSESGSGTTIAPYIYPQATASTLADKKKYVKLPSISVSTNMLYDGTSDSADSGLDLLGLKIGSCDIRAANGEPVSVSLNMNITDVALRKGSVDTAVPIDAVDVYHFIGASASLPGGTPIPNVINNFNISVNNGITYRHGLGTDKAKALLSGNRETTITISMTNESVSFIEDIIGGTTLSTPILFNTLVLSFEGDDGREFEITCHRCKINDLGLTGSHPNPIEENLTLYPELITCEEIFDAS